MWKKWLAEGLVSLLAITSTTPLEGSTAPTTTGRAVVQTVQERYEKGGYDNFFNSLQTEYERAGKAGVLRGLFESAKKTAKPNEGDIEDYRAQIAQLEKVRNQRLLDAIAENPDLEIVTKVDSVVFFSQSEEHKKVLAELDSLKFHIPETAEGTLENKISALETEYFIKSRLLDIVKLHDKISTEELTQKKIALQLKKLDRMLDVAREKKNEEWIQKMNLAKRAYISKTTYDLDLAQLLYLAYEVHVPKNSVEEKVKEIMMDYQNKKMASTDELVAKN